MLCPINTATRRSRPLWGEGGVAADQAEHIVPAAFRLKRRAEVRKALSSRVVFVGIEEREFSLRIVKRPASPALTCGVSDRMQHAVRT